MKIAMIVPNLPPALCGVYDYTRKLARHWAARAEWTLLCSHEGSAWPGANTLKIQREGASLAQELREIEPDVVGLQYTCFGYADNGVPEWLAEGLESFMKQSKARLAIMFHEFAYDGAPWRRAHWRKPRQTALASRLCHIADAALMGVPQWQQELKLLSKRDVRLAVIPSNIDPTSEPVRSGSLKIALFGLASSRERALAGHKRLLAALIDAQIEFELCIIGPGPTKLSLSKPGKIKVSTLPDAGENAVSGALAGCHALLSPYEAAEIWKSGAAMAALAHGCAVVALGTPKLGGPPVLTYGRRATDIVEMMDTSGLDSAGEIGFKWYQQHSGWPRAVAAWQTALLH